MARGDFLIFEEFAEQIGEEQHDFENDILKLGIVDNVITPAIVDATPTWADYSANEVSAGGGYVAGGITLANVVYNEIGGVATLDADDIAIIQDAGGFTDGYWCILYNSSNGTNMAIGFVELDGPLSEVAGPIAINWNASGITTVTVS